MTTKIEIQIEHDTQAQDYSVAVFHEEQMLFSSGYHKDLNSCMKGALRFVADYVDLGKSEEIAKDNGIGIS